jgi:DNA-directed RNA polymerase specialized sigma24 family protein
MEVSGSIQLECKRRLENLYSESHSWLLQTAQKVTKNREESEDLISELYEYLHKKQNNRIFFDNSYNLIYCMHFIKHRWINKTKKLKRLQYQEDIFTDDPSEEYDVDRDLGIMKAYDEVMGEIQRLKQTRQFASAMLYELYWTSDDTLQEVADKIGISKSTTFISVKKIRKYLENTLENPFKNV